jgi:polyhydroxyalkanoate synthesis regulator phasin
MKVAVALCLFACVAVSHAAFSGSLVQQAKPLVDQAMFKMRFASVSRSAEGSQFQTALVAGIQEHITSLLGQIEAGAAIVSQIQTQVQTAITTAVGSLAEIAQGVSGQVTGVVGHVQEVVGTFIQSIQGLFGSFFAQAIGQKGVWDILTGGFDLQTIIQNIKDLIAQHIGGLDIQAIINSVLGELGLPQGVIDTLTGFLTSVLPGQQRGLWDSIGGWWGQLTGAAAQAWAQLSAQMSVIIDHVVATGQASVHQIQEFATQFIEDATAHATTISADAADQILAFLEPYQHDLGGLWQQVLQTVSSIGGSTKIN